MYQIAQRRRVRQLGFAPGTQLGQPGTVWREVPIRHVRCSAAGLAELLAWTGHPWTCAEVRAQVEDSAGVAAAMAFAASRLLDQRSDDTITAFTEVFGFKPADRIPGYQWTVGQIVKARFDGVLKLMDGGGMLYSLGIPAQGGGPEPADRLSYQFEAQAGKTWIALGVQHFTEPFRDQRGANVLAAMLLAGYGEWIKRTSMARPLNNLFCYIKFVYRAWGGQDAPLWVQEHCPTST
jgi:hypothetical protein